MKENNEVITNDDTVSTVEVKEPEQEQEQEQKEERTFTQRELNEIIQKRVAQTRRSSEKETSELKATLEQRTQELDRRASLLDCRQYLIDNSLPSELLDIIETSDFGVFRKKVEALTRTELFRKSQPVEPVFNREMNTFNQRPSKDPFKSSSYSKHTPKKNY